jgi:hypothetical protein
LRFPVAKNNESDWKDVRAKLIAEEIVPKFDIICF